MAKLALLACLLLSMANLLFLIPAIIIIFVLKFQEYNPSEETLSPEHELALFRHMKQDYLKSTTWDTKRRTALLRDNYTCTSCGVTDVPLHVHHMSGYELIPNEKLFHLTSLCESCHTREHKTHGFPQTLQEYYDWNHQI